MTNAPTPSAMMAKASRKYWMKLVASLMSLESSAAWSAAVRTVALAGTTPLRSRTSALGSMPVDAAT